MESSGQAVFKTVPVFAFIATFNGDIEGFKPLKVLLATTVLGKKRIFACLSIILAKS